MTVDATGFASVEDALKQIPDDRLPQGNKQRLLQFARELDELPRVDERSGEAFVDEERARRLFEKLTPKSNKQFVDQLTAGSKDRPGGELLRKGKGRSRAISWKDFRSRVGAEEIPPEDTLSGWGLSPQSTDEEVREAVKRRKPNYPDELLEPMGMGRTMQRTMDRLASEAGREEPAPRAENWGTFWNCLGNSVPVWIIFALWGAAVGIMWGANLVGILIFAAIGFGLGVLFSVLGCLAIAGS
jgi:hypothetical protein